MNNSSKIKVGGEAPNFILPTANGENWRLSDRIGRVVALLFYPGNETVICVKQLCSVRDRWKSYIETGAEVVGISPDTVEQQLKFAQDYNLPMPLLSDQDREVTKIYGKHWWMPIWATRAVVVIDAKGKVRYQNSMLRFVRPSDDEVLSAINMAKYDALTEKRTRILN